MQISMYAAALLGMMFHAVSVYAQSSPPQGTISSNGGMNLRHGLVKENFVGLRPKHGKVVNFRTGRIIVETDPSRVRSGKSSIKFQVHPGDCGPAVQSGSWDDCNHRNERIELSTQKSSDRLKFYAFSVMLDRDFLSLGNYHPEVNLYQHYQDGTGACFNIQYSLQRKALHVQHRCVQGRYDHSRPQNKFFAGSVFDRWHEFVILARWSKGNDGLYRILHNGRLAYNYSGPTLASEAGNSMITNLFLYRYEGLGNTRTVSTAWFDDIVASKSFRDISSRYNVDKASLGVR